MTNTDPKVLKHKELLEALIEGLQSFLGPLRVCGRFGQYGIAVDVHGAGKQCRTLVVDDKMVDVRLGHLHGELRAALDRPRRTLEKLELLTGLVLLEVD